MLARATARPPPRPGRPRGRRAPAPCRRANVCTTISSEVSSAAGSSTISRSAQLRQVAPAQRHRPDRLDREADRPSAPRSRSRPRASSRHRPPGQHRQRRHDHRDPRRRDRDEHHGDHRRHRAVTRAPRRPQLAPHQREEEGREERVEPELLRVRDPRRRSSTPAIVPERPAEELRQRRAEQALARRSAPPRSARGSATRRPPPGPPAPAAPGRRASTARAPRRWRGSARRSASPPRSRSPREPPAPSTASVANCAAPENTIADITVGATVPQPAVTAETPNEAPISAVGMTSGRAARMPAA